MKNQNDINSKLNISNPTPNLFYNLYMFLLLIQKILLEAKKEQETRILKTILLSYKMSYFLQKIKQKILQQYPIEVI